MKPMSHRPLFAALLLAAVCLPSLFSPAAPPTAPRLACDAPDFDAGPVPPSSSPLVHAYPLRNDGLLPLEITKARTSAGGLVLHPPTHPLLPGESAELRAEFSLTGRSGPQSRTIVLSSNDPDRPTAFLSFRCDVVPPLSANPAALYFGRIDDPGTATRTVTLSADRPFTVLSAAAANSRYAVEIDSPDPSPLHRISLSVPPFMPRGPFGDTLTVDTDLPVTPRILVPFTGDWRATP